MRFLPSLAALVSVAALAAAPDSFTREELTALEAEKAEAEARLAALEAATGDTETDLARIDEQLIAAAMESRRREELATSSERKLIDLRTRVTSARIELLEDEAHLEDLLAALASYNRRRPPALAVSPDRANEAVRTAILMGDAAPRLSARSHILSREIATLRRLERGIQREKARLEASEATLALKQAEIERLAATKRARYEDVTSEAAALRTRVAALAEQADTLRALLTSLQAEAPALPGRKPALRPRYAALHPPASAPPAAAARPEPRLAAMQPLGAKALGRLAKPSSGLVARSYGDRTAGGGKSEGLTIVTRREANVSAPAAGRIEYAGPFRSYGEMLILRTSDGYHVILSGLGEIYASVGQTVSAGEPVGRMSNRANPPPELYMELRKDGRPMDPADWMTNGR